MNKINIIIADDIEETRNVIKKILNFESEFFNVVGEAGNGQEVLELIPKVTPDIVLMDINMPVLNGLETTDRITNEFPNVIVIIMSVQGESEYLKKAMLNGAKEYIIKPLNYDELVLTIKSTYEKYKKKLEAANTKKEKSYDAKIITCFSSKGGVGKSVIAVNSAILSSKEKNKKTLLIDLDLQFGDISMLVNQYNKKTILHIIEDNENESYENIKPYLYSYNDKLDILFAPGKPEAAEYITKDNIENLIKLLKIHYEIIIIDTGINFNDYTLFALDKAEIIYYVSTMEITSLKNTKLGLGVMQSLGYDKNKVKLIVNKFNTSFGISKKDVEDTFSDNTIFLVPDDEKNMSLSVNKGTPLCDLPKYNKLKIIKAFEYLCEKTVL